MSEKDPMNEAKNFFNQIAPLFSRLVEIEKFEEIIFQNQNNTTKLINTPKTFINNIKRQTHKIRKEINIDTNFLENLYSVMDFLKEEKDLNLIDNGLKVEKYDSLKVFLATFLEEIKRIDRSKFKIIIEYYSKISLLDILGIYPGIGSIIFNPTLVFEEWAGILSSQLFHLAERFYRPMLFILLKITRIINKEDCNDPEELGKIMKRCKDLWNLKYPDFLPILINDIKLIRNSEAHRNTEINVQEETITYVNNNNGKITRLGPLTKEELGRFSNEFIQFTISLQSMIELINTELLMVQSHSI